MIVRFFFSNAYNEALESIEDFILRSTKNLDQVERFLEKHDEVLQFIAENPNTPAVHPITGDQSWVFDDGKYRLFFNSIVEDEITKIYFTHIIDNRQLNLDIYPTNSIPTYDEE